MRIVHWKEEAEKICAIREGWSFKAVRRKKTQAIDWNNFEEAPFQENDVNLITIDFETYYDKGTFSLSKMTTEEYVRDDQFQVIGVAVKVNDQETEWASGTHEQIKKFQIGRAHV